MALEKPYRNQEQIKSENRPKTLTEESDAKYNFRIWAEKARKIAEEAKQPHTCVRFRGTGRLLDYSECPMCGSCEAVVPFYTAPFQMYI